MPIIIGLTGGIGSGKTVASDHFAHLGIEVIDTDIIARLIVAKGSETLQKLCNRFGTDILDQDGHLHRANLRKIAFANQENKSALDAITHPAIYTLAQSALHRASGHYCVLVVPLLHRKSPFFPLMQRILLISAEQETRIQRVMQRSNLSRKQVMAIMQQQIDDTARHKFATDIIENNTSIEHVQQQVESLHTYYCSMESLHSK